MMANVNVVGKHLRRLVNGAACGAFGILATACVLHAYAQPMYPDLLLGEGFIFFFLGYFIS